MKKIINIFILSLLITQCSSPSSNEVSNTPIDIPEDTISEDIFIEEEVVVEEIVEGTMPDNRPPQSATDEYLERLNTNALTFNNFWTAVFDGSLSPSDRSLNENRVAKVEIKPQQGFSTVAVFDFDLRDDNGYSRCGHGKCIVDIISQFYPGVGVQAISTEDYLMDGDAYLANLSAYYREDTLLENEGFITRGLAGNYLTMVSFFSQPNKGKAKIYTTSSSIGSNYTNESITAEYTEDENGILQRNVWRFYDSLAGERPFDSSMYELRHT